MAITKMTTDKYDCRFLSGYKPCKYHKNTRIPCNECTYYSPIKMRILIIKIGAAGEVIRNTPLLQKLRAAHPDAEITWITDFPALLPSDYVDRILKYSWETCLHLSEEEFDLLLNLDKEKAACALTNKINAKIKKGFRYSCLGKIIPVDNDSIYKWETGIDDTKMLNNRKNYVEEIFEICGLTWSGEKYLLPSYSKLRLINTNNLIVGINTGAGPLWRTRIPHIEKIEEIIRELISNKYEVLLLGGPDEDARNWSLKEKFDIHYFGVKSLTEFINIIDNCHAVITPVTMALHIAIGLGKHVVLLNNIFNKVEFHLYNNGDIIEPLLPCLGCYKKDFDSECPVNDCTLFYDTEAIMSSLRFYFRNVVK